MNFDQFKFVGAKVDLTSLPTKFDGGKRDSDLKKLSSKLWKEIADLQEKLYAESNQSLLIVLKTNILNVLIYTKIRKYFLSPLKSS